MSEAASQVVRYPLAAYNFLVTVGPTAMRFSEVSGLRREYEHVTYRHGFTFLEGEDIVKYRIDRYVPITMKRGVIRGSHDLHAWLEDHTARTLAVTLLDEQGLPVLSWRVAKALAVKLEAPGFDAATNEVAIETLEVMAAGISVQPEE